MIAKYFSLVAILLTSAIQCQELEELPEFVSGRLQTQRRGRAQRQIIAVCVNSGNADKTYCNSFNQCEADKVYQCNGIGTEVGANEYLCEGSMKYCREDVIGEAFCSDVAASTCPPTETFKCTGKGLYTEPSNCKKFYYCNYNATSGIYNPQTFTCPELYVFDPVGKNGEHCRLTNNNECITAACKAENANTNVPLVYPYFPKTSGEYIVRCKTPPATPDVFRCDASFEVVPNTYPVRCKAVCKSAANIAHPTIETKYYKCLQSGGKLEPFLNECFGDLKFDNVKKICI